ncbi:putative calcium/proton exchanger [Helianthus annuus]|nr:putative calcium/proton exchanger [Helianthus annuus]
MAYTWLLLITLSTLLIFTVVTSRTITTTSSPDLLSDGLEQERTLGLNPLVSADEPETCEQSYGFLPCTSTALGNLFLILVYGYLMFLAATYLSSGSELLLEILGPGFVGGLLLPSLGALPDAMLILVSGLSGSVEVA